MVLEPTTTTKATTMITSCDIKRIWRTRQDSNLRPLPSEGSDNTDVPEKVSECSGNNPKIVIVDEWFLDHGPETYPQDSLWVWVWIALTLMVIWFAFAKAIPQIEHDLDTYYQN